MAFSRILTIKHTPTYAYTPEYLWFLLIVLMRMNEVVVVYLDSEAICLGWEPSSLWFHLSPTGLSAGHLIPYVPVTLALGRGANVTTHMIESP